MANEPSEQVQLTGGPRDGAVLDTVDAPVVEIEIDGLIHRYVTTTKHRDDGDRSYHVYNYDGAIDPNGAMPGAETPDGGHHDPVQGV
ncbi:hypothetical protein [Dactylosporangium sp. NPDC051541]|uniref:hypothetical protein n=1 Tax=Dactylosporangium sp. NPDC051541 TaxID=3363977 RepID=UPI0037A3EA4B